MSYPTFPAYPPFPVSATKKKEDDGGGVGKKEAAAAMRRLAEMDLRDGGGDGGKAVVAVAVDGDRGSQHALKWAADHVLLSRAHPFFLLHVRRKHASLHAAGGKQFSILHVQDDVAAPFLDQMDHQTKDLMLPFQCFCNRRGLQCREIILDGTDVWKAIVDFVVEKKVDKLVLGASSRNAFTRTIKKLDVPTSVTKCAPSFCSVYVISKGKLSSFRPASRANANDTSKEELESNVLENQPLTAKSLCSSNTIPLYDIHSIILVSCELPPKIHTEGQNLSKPISVGAAMPIHASCDESTEGSLTSPDHQGQANSSYLKASSCPNEFLRNTNKQGGYLSREYAGYHRDILILQKEDNEQACPEHTKYLGFDESNIYNSALSPGYNVCDPLSPTLSEDCTESTSKYEDMEAVARQLKLEVKQKNDDIHIWNYKELLSGIEGGTENSYAIEHEDEHLQEFRTCLNHPCSERQNAEPSSAALGPKHKLLKLENFSSDQCRETTIQEFKDRSSQDVVHPILRRLPPKFYSPRNDIKHGSASEEAYNLELKSKPLPRPIETNRLLEGLPTRFQCKTYTTEEVANATGHFSLELKIGEGGYGPVYKATLDNTLVAAKILHSNITQGLKQFQQEVELLNNIRHPNMVHLLGACPEYGCLVYEYMPNGSLEDRLFCRSGTPPLPWQLRFKIAVEIATGLLYLHKMKPEAFVHRDLKPGNILLDKDFVSKIGDVGLARIIPRSMDMDDTVTQYRMTDAAGTFCYIDPEYQKTGLVTTKSDVYALGIIYLQMITAKDAMGLAYMVSDALEEGTFEQLLDPNVTGWPVKEAQKFAELSLKCCELRHRDRPDLESVVLPELIRLHTLVSSSDDSSSIDQGHQRSASDKELLLDNDLAEILNDGLVKGASFAV
uniref:Protein kinase domain-containing protein n=1 Tax=Leersia perrieri TaxID=77586 RepID=A0A0D9VCB1_9ORYZ